MWGGLLGHNGHGAPGGIGSRCETRPCASRTMRFGAFIWRSDYTTNSAISAALTLAHAYRLSTMGG